MLWTGWNRMKSRKKYRLSVEMTKGPVETNDINNTGKLENVKLDNCQTVEHVMVFKCGLEVSVLQFL